MSSGSPSFQARVREIAPGFFRMIFLLLIHLCTTPVSVAGGVNVTGSSAQPGSFAIGAMDGDRFSVGSGSVWRGRPGESQWWWQVDFGEIRAIQSVLQIFGDHEFVLRNSPRSYHWESSLDGVVWTEVPGSRIVHERRIFRIQKWGRPVESRMLRLRIDSVTGGFPTVRELEFLTETDADLKLPDWAVVVNCTHDSSLPNHGQEFIPLVRSVKSGEDVRFQQVWLDSFDEEFLKVEPLPLCAFLSGSFKDWCEVDRTVWRGTQEVLRQGRLPMWASCGGAQALAILAEQGTEKPWDCPHCRDPRNPKLPIYTHIGHTAARACGDYSGCVFERGPHWVKQVGADPVFAGLSAGFRVMESHCGQIEWPPRGWKLIATAGSGTKTLTQCLRLEGLPIYAAQFHIEMEGAPEASKVIVQNFLRLAREAGGYRMKPGLGR